MSEKNTTDYDLYKTGESYNNKIVLNSGGNFYFDINRNERYYAGNQWKGVQSNDLPTPVLNMFKRAIDHSISTILSNSIAVSIKSEELIGDRDLADRKAEVLTAYVNKQLEMNKADTFWRDSLYDSAISGDSCAYLYFDDGYDTKQDMKGIICMELVDNVNVFLGNPNSNIINKLGKPFQPYILITYRDTVENVRNEAKANGTKDVDKIVSDADYMYQSGDNGQNEQDNNDQKNDKCTVILKMWSKTKNDKTIIMARKSTQNAIVRKDYETKSTIYPVAIMNWTKRKNTWHGQAPGTGLVPNQIIINKLLAMASVSVMRNAFPQTFYDSDAVAGFTNAIGKAIGIKSNGQPLSNYVYQFNKNGYSPQVTQLIELIIKYTMEMMGMTETSLGQVKPENTSAIVALTKQAAMALENVRANLYQYVEDIVHVYLDMFAGYYGERVITAETSTDDASYSVDFSKLREMMLSVKVDVGPSNYWSELTAIQTLDNLLERQLITFEQYLERLPEGFVEKKQQLIEEIKAKAEQAMQQGMQGGQPPVI